MVLWLIPLAIEFISGINRPQRKADHSPLLNAEVNGTLQFTCVSPSHLVFLLYEFYCTLVVVYCYLLRSHRIRMCSCHIMTTLPERLLSLHCGMLDVLCQGKRSGIAKMTGRRPALRLRLYLGSRFTNFTQRNHFH